MKIDRHEIIGVVTAIEDWFTMDHEERILEYEARFAVIDDALRDVDGVSTRRIEIHHYVPYMMLVDVDESVVGKTAEQVRVELGQRQSAHLGRGRGRLPPRGRQLHERRGDGSGGRAVAGGAGEWGSVV